MGRTWQVTLIFLALLGYAGWVIAELNTNVGYAPEQPLPFSHKIHAGDNKIPCLYCHAPAEKGRHATVPPMNVCMGCHKSVAVTKENIIKLAAAYKADSAIAWVRVHALPDFTYFSHRWHLAKGIACQTCHGPVERMDKIVQVQKLNMGWCITCHRQNKASIECITCHN